MGGFIKRFRFSGLAIFRINSYLNYFSRVLLLEFVTARSAGLMRGAASQTHPGLFPRNFRLCSSSPTHWADLSPTLCFAGAIAPFCADLPPWVPRGVRMEPVGFVWSHTGVPSPAQAGQGLFPSGSGLLSPPAEGG